MCFRAGSLPCGSLLRQGGSESPARSGSQVRAAGSAAAAYTKVMERLCDTINNLSANRISSITGRDWILSIGV